MKKMLFMFFSLTFFLCSATFCMAECNLRYKPVVVQDGRNSAQPAMVLIVDQAKGDVWLWKADRISSKDGSVQANILFQGNLEKIRKGNKF